MAHAAVGQDGCSFSGLEVRKFDRYRLGAPVAFWWDEPDGRRGEASGFTRDISTIGMYVYASTCPPAGRSVHMNVSLPSLHGKLPGWRLETQARVVRVEHSLADDNLLGFAVSSGDVSARLRVLQSL